MILGSLTETSRLEAAQPAFVQAFRFLRRPDLALLQPGRIPIADNRIYALVQRGPGRRREDARLETHQQYLDIQYIVSGTDDMGWRDRSTCRRPADAYAPEKDIQFYLDAPDTWIPVHAGAFVVFFPEDAHLPSISAGELHKIVIKIAVTELVA